ncbi:muramoyltetrapeptide carboxypeptidase, partial [Lecanoromycetidae sp. Uapishka_2]
MAVERVLPEKLQMGDTIAFISPSARLNLLLPAPLERAKVFVEGLGYHVKVYFNNQEPADFHDSVLQRCEEVHEAFRDTSVKAIICTIGGSNANELLPHLDYQLIKSHPKIFCGYSDITLLHYAILSQTGLQTFYGPTAFTDFADVPKPFQFTVNHFLQVLKGSAGKAIGSVPRSPEWAQDMPDFFGNPSSQKARGRSPSPSWRWLRNGHATGRWLGGCLPSLLRLTGTRFWPAHRGCILFLETPTGPDMKDPFSLGSARACMADLVNVGVFEEIGGLVIGRPYGYDEEMREEFAQLVADQCYGTTFPILLNFDIGHTAPILTLPMNAMVSMDSGKDEVRILEPGVLG